MWEEFETGWMAAEDFFLLLKNLGHENVYIRKGTRKQVKKEDEKISDLISAVLCVKKEVLDKILTK